MRSYLLAAYAMLMRDQPEPGKIEALLDEPFAFELSAEERRLAEARRVADANRAAQQQLAGTASMVTPGR